MNDAGFVGFAHRAQHLLQKAKGFVGAQLALRGDAVSQRLPLQHLHRDERGPLLDAVVEDLHDVRAAQRRGGLGLAQETPQHLFVAGDRRIEQLDRDRALQLDVLGPPDRAHTAPPEE